MTLLGVLTALAVLGGIVLLVVLFVQRGREGIDLSLGALLRAYLYLASLAGVIVFSVGLAGVLAYVLAAGLGRDVIYGGPQFIPATTVSCPPGQTCPPPVQELRPIRDDRDRRQADDLVRGVTFLTFGAIIWGAHWGARRFVGAAGERGGALHRGYLMLGTAIFGVATIALLPMGIYQALSFALVPFDGAIFRQAAGESLSGGLAALPLWLGYLWLVLRALRGGNGRLYAPGGSGGPPAEPAPVGARIGPGPGERSAGAEAATPGERR